MKFIKDTTTQDANLITDAVCTCSCHEIGQKLSDMCATCKTAHKSLEHDMEIPCSCRCHLTWCGECEANHMIQEPGTAILTKITYADKTIEAYVYDQDPVSVLKFALGEFGLGTKAQTVTAKKISDDSFVIEVSNS